MVNMQQMPGQGGKAAVPQGKGGAMPQGKQGASQGKQGAPGGQQGTPPSQMQGQIPTQQGVIQAPGGSVGATDMRQQAQGKPGFPIFSPTAQGFEGASASASNPNEGGSEVGPSALSDPSMRQGGMGGV